MPDPLISLQSKSIEPTEIRREKARAVGMAVATLPLVPVDMALTLITGAIVNKGCDAPGELFGTPFLNYFRNSANGVLHTKAVIEAQNIFACSPESASNGWKQKLKRATNRNPEGYNDTVRHLKELSRFPRETWLRPIPNTGMDKYQHKFLIECLEKYEKVLERELDLW